MDSRQQFEEWVRTRAEKAPSGFYPQLLHRCTLDETSYVISWVDSAFEGWQASRESLVVELPSLSGMNSSFVADGIQKTREHNRYNSAIDDCRKAINATGIRTK